MKRKRSEKQQRFAIAALLHDAVEDQGGEATKQEIYRLFGTQVGEIVDDCTEFRTEIKPPWQERKLNYIQQLRVASSSARRVALADKLHNMRSEKQQHWALHNRGRN